MGRWSGRRATRSTGNEEISKVMRQTGKHSARWVGEEAGRCQGSQAGSHPALVLVIDIILTFNIIQMNTSHAINNNMLSANPVFTPMSRSTINS